MHKAAGYTPRQLPNPPDGGPYGEYPDHGDSPGVPPACHQPGVPERPCAVIGLGVRPVAGDTR